MEPCKKLLSLDEIKRNQHGPMLIYTYADKVFGKYDAPEYFAPVKENHAVYELVNISDIFVPRERLIKGAYPGAKMDVYYPGFPTMKHLKYTGKLEKAKIKVFEQASKGYNMLLILNERVDTAIEKLATELLNKVVFVGWPHLVEAKIISISNKKFRYHAIKDGKYNVETITENSQSQLWHGEMSAATENFKNRFGVVVGPTDILVHVKLITGRKYVFSQQSRLTYEKQWSDLIYAYPLQSVVRDISVYNPNDVPYQDIENVFPIGSCCFMLGQPHYASVGKVMLFYIYI